MKALIVIIASVLSAQAMAAAVVEVKPIELRPLNLRPIEMTPARPAAQRPALRPAAPVVVATPDVAAANGAQAQCGGDLADQLSQGSQRLNGSEVREALRFFGNKISVGHCQGTNKAAKGLLGYAVDRRENFLLATIDAMNELKREGATSAASVSAARLTSALDSALAKTTTATTASLRQCGITNI